uniref:Uncharacterized protein n=1 Tax=Junco hyemalis TaxID=40217 RepID=A0A8C5JCK8_JUNHY
MIHWKTSTGEPVPNSGQPWREPVPGTGQELLPERRGRGDRALTVVGHLLAPFWIALASGSCRWWTSLPARPPGTWS